MENLQRFKITIRSINCFISSHRRQALLAFFLFHLSLILTVCIYTTIDSYVSFYKGDDKNYKYPGYLTKTRDALLTTGLYHYSVLAGVDAGYGFFAPNVASEYVLEFNQQDKNGETISTSVLPDFQCKESIQKYSTMLGAFQEKVKFYIDSTKGSKLYMRYLDVIIKSIAQNVLKSNKGAASVIATLYMYNYPSLADYEEGKHKVQLMKVVQFTIHQKNT